MKTLIHDYRNRPGEQSSAANRQSMQLRRPRPPRWQKGGGVRNNAYLRLLLCEQRQGAAHGGIGDGSRLYPAPALGHMGAPSAPDGGCDSFAWFS